MIGKTKTISSMLILVALGVCLLGCVVDASDSYSDLPPPPNKPERFTSRDQLREYLVKLHEYYAIIGRPRFGRSMEKTFAKQDQVSSLSKLVFNRIDQDRDSSVSEAEFHQFVEQALL